MRLDFQLIKENVKKCKAFFLDLVFPVECFGCGREGAWLCRACLAKIKFNGRQYCLRCKRPNDLGRFCPACQPAYALDGVWIAGNYEEAIMEKLIKALKYRFVYDLAWDLARFLALFLDNFINDFRINKEDLSPGLNQDKLKQSTGGRYCSANIMFNFSHNLVIPVPLHRKRLRWRGFNQAEAIAGALAGQAKLKLVLEKLVRIKHSKPQVKLNEQQRQLNIRNCFAWRGADLDGADIILVDDVVTTGATLNECAHVLKAHGAGEIWGLVVAKG